MSLRDALLRNIQTPEQLFTLIDTLPDPDPIFRQNGTSHTELYNVMRDPHVLAELRTLRANLLTSEIVLQQKNDDATSQKSLALVNEFFRRAPAKSLNWSDIDWHNYSAILHGSSVTAIGAYERKKGRWLPSSIKQWSNRFVQYTKDGELHVCTAEHQNGEPADAHRFTCVRHFVSAENPYGIAMLSSAWWYYTLKKIGVKSFGNSAERFGTPFPVIRYPDGAKDAEINALLQALISALDNGIAAIPESASIDLKSLEKGEPLPKMLADWCNKEMSKLLTSQTLATEQAKNGARAAAETHQKRADKNSQADRQLVIDARNQIARAIHELNFDGGEPPTFQFNDPQIVTSETIARVTKTAALVQVPESWVYEQLGAPRVEEGDTPFKPLSSPNQTDRTSKNGANFSATDDDWDGFDEATNADVLAIKNALDSADDLHDFQAYLEGLYPGINTGAVSLLDAQTQHDYLTGATTDD